MATLRTIIDALRGAQGRGERVVLATVVRITGSSYGGVGTRMVIGVDGSTVGLVSGGCLESDLAEHANEVYRLGEPRVVTYDTRADDDTAWGLGLGCNGLIDVFLEPLDGMKAGELAELLEKARSGGAVSVLATAISGGKSVATGAHALLSGENISTTGNWDLPEVIEYVRAAGPSAFNERRRGIVGEYGDTTIAFEVITPAVDLVVCGGGPDVLPVARFAAELGWNVTVVDHRPLTQEHQTRFPDARVIECADPSAVASLADVSEHTAAVVMSHHFARDLEYVRALLESSARYIGVLGPRARSERMIAELSASGHPIQSSERLHSPIGLNIGADGPEGIALSIVSEVSAVMTGSQVKHLRDHAGALHPVSTPG